MTVEILFRNKESAFWIVKANTYTLILAKRPTRHRWVDNIRMGLGEVGWGDVDWIVLAQDRNRWKALVNSVLNLRVP
jgi:hypothetical protein